MVSSVKFDIETCECTDEEKLIQMLVTSQSDFLKYWKG